MIPEQIELANGPLCFSGRAMGDGPVVLLIHGFPDCSATFDHQLRGLAEAGFRAIAMATRGYQPSSQPENGDYHSIRLAEDVVAWADALGVQRVHLVGHDWGANIAYAAAALAPERFASLATLAVPHPARFAQAYALDAEQQARSAYILDFLAPGFEERIVADDCAYLKALWRAWSPTWTIPTEALAAMRSTMIQPGVARAALEYYRQAFDAETDAGKASQALLAQPLQVPTLGLCGSDDGCISADIFEAAMRSDDFAKGVKVIRLEGAGHFLHAEKPDAVNAVLCAWCAGQD